MQEEHKRMKDDMAIYLKYMKQQMRMIWTLPMFKFFL